METWQKIIVLLLAGGVTFFFLPGVKQMLKQSEDAEKDWPSILIPIALVVLFVLLLIALV